MKSKYLVAVVSACVFLFSCSNRKPYEEIFFNDGKVESIKKYKIFPTEEVLKVTGGYPPAIGSSLMFHEKKDGSLFFYAISDRGPNGPVKYADQTKVVFFHPEYSPIIASIKVNEKGAKIDSFFNVTKQNNKTLTGMPTDGIEGPSFYKVPINSQGEDIVIYEEGADSESITMDQEGNFWIGEEYDPGIIKVNGRTKKITKIYKPGKGLPDFVSKRQINRGFEALAVTPSGKVFAIIEGALNFGNDSLKKSKFVRMLEINPENDNVKAYAYMYDYQKYSSPKKAKIGDLSAIDNNNFLLVEQGEVSKNKTRNVIYKINIEGATELIDNYKNSKTHIELMNSKQLSKLNLVTKKMLLDVNKYGWDKEKLEGLTIIDNKTIAISDDNDFGIDDIRLSKKCYKTGCSDFKVVKETKNQYTNLWIIKLKDPFF